MQGGVVVLSGPPCAGKSSVVTHLLSDGSATGQPIYLRVDALFDLLLPRSDRNRADRQLAYDAAHAVARRVVDSGRTAVLECTYARVEQRASLVEVLGDTPTTPLHVVELQVTPEHAVQRFRERPDATDLDETSLRERVANFPYSPIALRLDSVEASPEDLALRIREWLRQSPEPVERELWVRSGRGWK